MNNNMIIGVVIALVSGGLVEYYTRGQLYNDSELTDSGEQLQEDGQMMQNQGSIALVRGSGMTQMMGQ